eukprot:14122349-Ditylum_brightwellii.AAC.1
MAGTSEEKEGTEPAIAPETIKANKYNATDEFIKLDSILAGHTIAMTICGELFKNKNQEK